MQFAGIILCGGHSRRMGQPKALLPFGGQTMLEHVILRLKEVLDPIVVVAAADQALPPLGRQVIVARDERPNRGPLEGFRSGLSALRGVSAIVYLTGCDTPLIKPELARLVCSAVDGEADAAVPLIEGKRETLASACRSSVLEMVEQMLEEGESHAHRLFDRVRTRWLASTLLQAVDPQLLSLRNVNTPADYAEALRLAQFTPQPPTIADTPSKTL